MTTANGSGDTNRGGIGLVTAGLTVPEGDLVLPVAFEADEVFQLLDEDHVVYDVHRSPRCHEPQLRAYEREFIGVSGVRRFLRYRRAGLLEE